MFLDVAVSVCFKYMFDEDPTVEPVVKVHVNCVQVVVTPVVVMSGEVVQAESEPLSACPTSRAVMALPVSLLAQNDRLYRELGWNM
jgi:hypothetical protein